MRDSVASAPSQAKKWTFGNYWLEFKAGWWLMLDECLTVMSELRAKYGTALEQDASQEREPSDLEMPRTSSSSGSSGSEAGYSQSAVGGQQYPARLIRSGHRNLGQLEDDELQPTALTYGISVLARLYSAILLWLPAFIIDTRLGLLPSRKFVILCYSILFGGILLGLFLAKVILEPLLFSILLGRTNNFISLFALTSGLCYVFFSLFCLFTLVYHRREIQEFLLYHCSIITLPKRFQQRQVVQLFILLSLSVVCLQPLLIMLTIILDSKAPHLLYGRIDERLFALIRWATVLYMFLGACILSSSCMIVPTISCYLIVCATQSLKDLLQKHLVRLNNLDPIRLNSHLLKSWPNGRLVQLLDAKTSQMIRNYACDTLTFDWPQLTEAPEEGGEAEASKSCFKIEPEGGKEVDELYVDKATRDSAYVGRMRRMLVKLADNPRGPRIELADSASSGQSAARSTQLGWSDSERAPSPNSGELLAYLSRRRQSERLGSLAQNQITIVGATGSQMTTRQSVISASQQRQANYNSNAIGLLFLYKNLIKSLSELKGMIMVYERRFGLYHLASICLDGLLIAQWVTTSITEARIIRSIEAQQRSTTPMPMAKEANSTELPALPNEGGARLAAGALEETSSFDLMSYSSRLTLTQVRIIIFSIIFVISNVFVFLHCDRLAAGLVKLRSQLFKMNINQACLALEPYAHLRQLQERPAGWLAHEPTSDWAELDHIWSLYDQVIRVSKRANFRLTPGTPYSKKCLLAIFGRIVSFILLCIQIVDIYSSA